MQLPCLGHHGHAHHICHGRRALRHGWHECLLSDHHLIICHDNSRYVRQGIWQPASCFVERRRSLKLGRSLDRATSLSWPVPSSRRALLSTPCKKGKVIIGMCQNMGHPPMVTFPPHRKGTFKQKHTLALTARNKKNESFTGPPMFLRISTAALGDARPTKPKSAVKASRVPFVGAPRFVLSSSHFCFGYAKQKIHNAHIHNMCNLDWQLSVCLYVSLLARIQMSHSRLRASVQCPCIEGEPLPLRRVPSALQKSLT